MYSTAAAECWTGAALHNNVTCARGGRLCWPRLRLAGISKPRTSDFAILKISRLLLIWSLSEQALRLVESQATP